MQTIIMIMITTIKLANVTTMLLSELQSSDSTVETSGAVNK